MSYLSKILSIVALLSFLAITTINAATFSGKVVRVLDGDTIEVLVDKEPIRVRLADIDCPMPSQNATLYATTGAAFLFFEILCTDDGVFFGTRQMLITRR